MTTPSVTLPEGSRMTKQRRVILEYLQSVDKHPTAEKVYAAVRGELKNISLGTVYRTLDFLVSQGQIKKIDTGKRAHYSAQLENVAHFICIDCDVVKSIPGISSGGLTKTAKQKVQKIGLPKVVQLNVFGLCDHCK